METLHFATIGKVVCVRNLDEAARVLGEKGAEFLWEPRDSKGGRIRVVFIRKDKQGQWMKKILAFGGGKDLAEQVKYIR